MHAFADDTQIYGFCQPSGISALQEQMSACIDDVALWMGSNRLQLNTAKTELLWCSTGRRQHQIPKIPTRVGENLVVPAIFIRYLGIYLDADATMRTHVSKTVSCCFGALRQIRNICSCFQSRRCYLWSCRWSCPGSTTAAQHSLVFRQTQRSAAVRAERRRTTSLLQEEVRPRDAASPGALLAGDETADCVQVGCSCLPLSRWPCAIETASLANDLQCVADLDCRRRLRSSSTSAFVVPSTCLSTVGDRAFPVAAGRVWNTLPAFMRQLKTVLFERSFPNSSGRV